MSRYFKNEIYLFILDHGKEEDIDVSNWVCELVTALQKKNIHCVKETDYANIGENVYRRLEHAIKNSRNIMVVIPKGFVKDEILNEKLCIVFHLTIERQVPLIPISDKYMPISDIPILLCATECLYVDFSRPLQQADVRKIERSIRNKSERVATVDEINQILATLQDAIERAPTHVLSAVTSTCTQRFPKLCTLFTNAKEKNRQNVSVRRTVSDTSYMHHFKEQYSRVGPQKVMKKTKLNRRHSFGQKHDFSEKRVFMTLEYV